MSKTTQLSIIIPCYNEQERLFPTIQSLVLELKKLNVSYEIILINDGSHDRTRMIMKEIALAYDHIRIVSYRINRGKGYAVKRGVKASIGAYYLIMDADMATDLKALHQFRNKRLDADCIIGNRNANDNKRGFFRTIGSRIAHSVVTSTLGLNVHDTQCGFKLLSSTTKGLWAEVHSERWGFDFELLYILKKHNYSIKELAVKWSEIPGSKVKISSYINTFKELHYTARRHNISTLDRVHHTVVASFVVLGIVLYGVSNADLSGGFGSGSGTSYNNYGSATSYNSNGSATSCISYNACINGCGNDYACIASCQHYNVNVRQCGGSYNSNGSATSYNSNGSATSYNNYGSATSYINLTPKVSGGGGGGGGTDPIMKDKCQGSDLSPSYYDGICTKALVNSVQDKTVQEKIVSLVDKQHTAAPIDLCPYADGQFQLYKSTFTDVTKRQRNGVYKMIDYCLIHGIAGDEVTYGTERNVTYGELYKIYARLARLSFTGRPTDSDWSTRYFRAGNRVGLRKNIDIKKLTDDPITKSDLLSVTHNLYDFLGQDLSTKKFTITRKKYPLRGDLALFLDQVISDLEKNNSISDSLFDTSIKRIR